jgi:hypothetical protein
MLENDETYLHHSEMAPKPSKAAHIEHEEKSI